MASQETAPAAPKKPLSAFFLYIRDNYDRVLAEKPTIKITEVTKLIAQDWKALGDEAKVPYQKRADEAKVAYNTELATYTAKYGKPERRKKRVRKEKKAKKSTKKGAKKAQPDGKEKRKASAKSEEKAPKKEEKSEEEDEPEAEEEDGQSGDDEEKNESSEASSLNDED